MNLQEEAYINYLKHCYDVPNELPKLPLDYEPYVAMWQKAEGKYVLDCLKEAFGLPVFNYQWENKDDLSISFTETLGGRLPVITTKSHKDFLFMDALLNGREQSREETEIQTRLSRQENKIKILTALAGKSIFDRLGNNDLR